MVDVCQKHDAKLLTYGTLVRLNSLHFPNSPDPARDVPILDIVFLSIDQCWVIGSSRLLALLVLAGASGA